MTKLRSVSTGFWSDPFIEDLTPNQKLLFLYLITNEKTNMLGIYEASIKKISFETDIKKDQIETAFELFEKKNKVKYVNNYVILVNYMKHQNFNTNMKKSAIDVYNNLPEVLKIKGLTISKDNPSEAFESLSKHFGTVSKIEVEYEYEIEVEEEVKSETKKGFDSVEILESFPFEDFWNYYDKKVGNKSTIEKKFKKLSEEDKQAIFETLPDYKASTPDKQYRKNPETYLNQRTWEHEIINKNDSNNGNTETRTLEQRLADIQKLKADRRHA